MCEYKFVLIYDTPAEFLFMDYFIYVTEFYDNKTDAFNLFPSKHDDDDDAAANDDDDDYISYLSPALITLGRT